jgi:regulator of nucleoside diphosphate kinase
MDQFAGPSAPQYLSGWYMTMNRLSVRTRHATKRARLFITEADFSRLSALLESAKRFFLRDREHLSALEEELNRAEIVAPNKLPKHVITMNCRVRVTDLDTGTQAIYTLSFPRDADIAHDRISVLAPIGTALLGYRAGAVIDADVPRGKKRLRIEEVMPPAQPQTAA